MIRLVTEEQLPRLQEICARDPVSGVQLLSQHKSWRQDWERGTLWVGENRRGRPQYLLGRSGDFFRIAGRRVDRMGELVEFLQLQGCRSVQGEAALMQRLGRYIALEPYTSLTMTLRRPQPFSGDAPPVPCPSLSRFYEMTAAGYPYFRYYVPREEWMTSQFAQLRAGCLQLWQYEEAGQPVCGGALTAPEGTPWAMIGTISTHPDYRGRGYASRMVRFLCGQAASLGRRVCLDCGEPELEAFYRPLGFAVSGQWTALEPPDGQENRKEDNIAE